MSAARQTISFILPVYNERPGIRSFFAELVRAVSDELSPRYDLEFLFVDDGSTDGSLEILKALVHEDSRASVIQLSRNFGHQIAITAGLDIASGAAAIIMDTDLQDPPAVCLDLIRAWERGAEVVFARRVSRRSDTFFKKLTARLFYRILNLLSDIPIPDDTGDFRLLDRKAVEAMKRYRESNRFVRGISAHIGFAQAEVPFDRGERVAGETHYPFRKMLRFSTDAIMSFSTVPLKLISRVGFFVSVLSVLGIAYAMFVKFFEPAAAVPGWTFVMIAVFFIGGVQLVMLGIIGGYIARIYTETRGRPLYLISATHTGQQHR